MKDCRDIDALLDVFVDGEGEPEGARDVREHLDGCVACRKEFKLRARLKLKVADAAPTAPPELRARVVAALDRADRPARPWRLWFASAAGILVVVSALLIFPRPAPALPPIIKATSEFHDRVVAGGVTPQMCPNPASLQAWFKENLRVDVAVPQVGGGCCMQGGCKCPLPEAKALSPFIVYKRGDVALSLLVVESVDALPDSARRAYRGHEYHVFRSGENTIVACKAGKLCHLWTARLSEASMLDLVLATREGQQAFSGARLTVRGITCQACCAAVELNAKQVPGVTDANVDMQSMELIVTGESVDLQKVIDALKNAGFEASRK